MRPRFQTSLCDLKAGYLKNSLYIAIAALLLFTLGGSPRLSGLFLLFAYAWADMGKWYLWNKLRKLEGGYRSHHLPPGPTDEERRARQRETVVPQEKDDFFAPVRTAVPQPAQPYSAGKFSLKQTGAGIFESQDFKKHNHEF